MKTAINGDRKVDIAKYKSEWDEKNREHNKLYKRQYRKNKIRRALELLERVEK